MSRQVLYVQTREGSHVVAAASSRVGRVRGRLGGRVETTSVTGAEKQRFRVGCTCNSHPTRSARNSLVTASRPVFVFAPDRTAPPRWWSHPTNNTHQHPSLPFRQPADSKRTMDDFNSETDSDYTSYWRDWVGTWTPPFTFGSGVACVA